MTEHEAYKKTCPMGVKASGNGSFCIAFNCMAWRWGGRGNTPQTQIKHADKEIEGYCGLAGKPI